MSKLFFDFSKFQQISDIYVFRPILYKIQVIFAISLLSFPGKRYLVDSADISSETSILMVPMTLNIAEFS